MGIYGSVGYTRRSAERERILNSDEKKTVSMLESQKRSLENQYSALYADDNLDDAELAELVKPIQAQISSLIDKICDIKYTRI